MGIYEPAEDSYLMQRYVRELALGRVLDMGTGTGIQALTAITNPKAQLVLAADVSPDAVAALSEKIKSKRIRKLQAVHSDLFSNIKGRFNLIIFNPPYLPQDRGIEDRAIYGGEKGWEFSERFFKEASAHLFPDGKILFLFSSLTDKKKIEVILAGHLFQFRELERQKIAFEELYLYLIEKSPPLRELEKKGLQDLAYFTHGKRGNIYRATLDTSQFVKKYLPPARKNIDVAVKMTREESKAKNRIENEARWLQAVNREGIGPRYLFHGPNYVAYEFIDGQFIKEWLSMHERAEILPLLEALLQQCRTLDRLQMNKEELHRPFKHILVTAAHQPVLIDFERAVPSSKPKNVTQFLEFLCRIRSLLQEKGIPLQREKVQQAAAEYKRTRRPFTIENLAL